jgi:hypothetical protein
MQAARRHVTAGRAAANGRLWQSLAYFSTPFYHYIAISFCHHFQRRICLKELFRCANIYLTHLFREVLHVG